MTNKTIRKIKRSDCNGCYKEFYHNGGANGDTKKCWSFDNATMSKGRIQGVHTMPENYKGRFVLIPDCYKGQNTFVEREDD